MGAAASLNLLLTANASQYETVMGKASRTAKATGGAMSSAAIVAQKAGKTITSALAVAGVGIGLEVARRGAVEMIDAFESADLMAQRLGISFNSLRTLQQVAAENGSSAETMNTALQKMTKVLGDAAYGEKAAETALSRLNLTFGQLKTLAPEQQFATIMERIRGLATEEQRATVLQDIFGKGASELGNLLGMTTEEMAAFTAELAASGQLLSGSQIEDMRKAADSVDAMGRAWEGFKTKLVTGAAPAIIAALDGIADKMERIANINPEAIGGVAEWVDWAVTPFNQRGQKLDYGADNSGKLAPLTPAEQARADGAAARQAAEVAAGPAITSTGFRAIDNVFTAVATAVNNGAMNAAQAIEQGAAMAALNDTLKNGGIAFRSFMSALADEAESQWSQMSHVQFTAAAGISAGTNEDRLFSLRAQMRAQQADANPINQLVDVQEAALDLLESVADSLRQRPVEFDL